MGGYGEYVTEPGDIRPALERARASGKPSLVNVMIDPHVYSSGTRNQTLYR
jgi:thiamine pyrophosphate-dependent acetolactate synthase large subunit-like protein